MLIALFLLSIVALVGPFVAARMYHLRHSLPSAHWKVRGRPFVVYVLRDNKGRPLYLGYSQDFAGRLRKHLADKDPWKREIDRFNCCQVRWCKSRQQGLRIERRRIRAATIQARWRLIPPLHNEAEVNTQRVWFPRLWAVLYLLESALCQPCRLTGPVLGAVREAVSQPEANPTWAEPESGGDKLRAEYRREAIALGPAPAPAAADGEGASGPVGDPPLRSHPSGVSGSARVAPSNADADSVGHPPSGGSPAVADADADHSVRSASAWGDLEGFVTVRGPSVASTAPSGPEAGPAAVSARPSAPKRAARSGARGGQDRTAYNREQKRRARARQRGES